MSIHSNRAVVQQAIAELLHQKDVTALDRYWGGHPYVQHNPTLPDGVDVLKELVPATQAFDVHRTLAEDDYVVTHSLATGWGPQPMVVFDIFRLQKGKMVEHWDVMLPQVEKTVSGRTQLDGSTQIVDVDKTAANKQKIREFLEVILYGGQMDKITHYISPVTYWQHNPGVGDGLDGLGKAMSEMAQAGLSMTYKQTHRIIAEGNFVFTHSEGEFMGKPVAFADLFRLENGLIVEHWDVIQEVPTESKNANGIF